MADKDKNLIEELEKRLCWYRDEATDEEFDAEEVDAICVMLQKLSPVEEPHMTREEARQNIMRRIREEEKACGSAVEENDTAGETDGENINIGKSGRKCRGRNGTVSLFRRKGYRAAILFVVVFGAALLSLNMVTYARGDKSLFTMILERVGVLEIVKEEMPEDVDIAANNVEGIKSFCDSWGELDSDVKSKVMVPGYIPDGFELYGINYYEHINRKRVFANYYDKSNGHLVIEVILWENGEEPYREMAKDEEAYTLISKYSSENTLYYEYNDEYICMTSMKNSFYRISGNVTLEEMIKVREGLYNNK